MEAAIIVLASVVYALVYLVAARMLAGHLAWNYHERARARHPLLYEGKYASYPDRPDRDQWLGSWLQAIMYALVWPLVAFVWWTGRHLGRRRLLPAVGAERRAMVRKQEQRIKELERELEVR